MPIFQVTPKELKALSETSFGAEGILERKDIQRLLREKISVLGDVLEERFLVIAEEFGDFLDSSRRIDLLCIDSDGNLVVVELKRSDDGGHMELQALRYAAMVSAMTFDQLVETFARYRNKAEPDIEAARSKIMDFLDWDDIGEEQFAQDTHIVLAAADFSKELTTAVMWLIEHGISIRCVRMKPWRMGDGTVLLDMQQLIPLPQAIEFQTQIGLKKQAERQSRMERHDLRLKFWEGFLNYAKTKSDVYANLKPNQDNRIQVNFGRPGFRLVCRVHEFDSLVQLAIKLGSGQAAKNKAAFKALEAQKTAIEEDFGGPLEWQEMTKGEGSHIRCVIEGGYRSPTEQWPAIQAALTDAMVRLNTAVRARVAMLNF
jgi:hypothetical protein